MGPLHKNIPDKEKPLLLFAPLDWGLGHTTRSIPLIRELKERGLNVVVACDSMQKRILEQEIPQLRTIPLDGYNIQYGKNGFTTRFHLLWQTNKILTKIKSENRWLKRFMAENPVAAIVSDNRYGLYSPTIPSILITHQLSVKTGFGRLADVFVRKKLYRLIEKFQACWIPDLGVESKSLAGALSHPDKKPGLPLRYLGCLSRFTPCSGQTPHRATEAAGAGVVGTGQQPLLILLSGPEPQRSIFERAVCEQLQFSRLPTILVRGLPAKFEEPAAARKIEDQANIITRPASATDADAGEQHRLPLTLPAHCKALEYVGTRELNQLICAAPLVICRPGYTTLMDMIKLRKKTVMIPTPGQAEQEYLARRAHSNGLALTMPQHRFSIDDAIDQAIRFEYAFPDAVNMEAYREVLGSFAESLLSQCD